MTHGHDPSTPPETRAVLGNPGHRRARPAPRLPDTGPAVRPDFLRGRAVELWNEYGPTLAELGTLRRESSHLFAMWCALTADFERSPRKFTASRLTQVRLLAGMLGMDPASPPRRRAELDNADPAEGFFTGPRAVL